MNLLIFNHLIMKAKIIYVDMDDVLCDYKNAYANALQNNPDIKYPQSQIDFYRKLKPIDGAIEGFNYLYKQAIFDVYILTAPSVKNPLCYLEKRLWIEDYFGLDVAGKLIISPNKGLLKGDFLIDDLVNGRGQENFEGEIIHFGTEKYLTWKNVMDKFK
jgi:5'-nucleotidase